jgi:hypothetical protein
MVVSLSQKSGMGLSDGVVSELTAMFDVKPATRSRYASPASASRT